MVVSQRLIAEVSKPYRDLKLIPRQIQRTRSNGVNELPEVPDPKKVKKVYLADN